MLWAPPRLPAIQSLRETRELGSVDGSCALRKEPRTPHENEVARRIERLLEPGPKVRPPFREKPVLPLVREAEERRYVVAVAVETEILWKWWIVRGGPVRQSAAGPLHGRTEASIEVELDHQPRLGHCVLDTRPGVCPPRTADPARASAK